MTLKNEWDKRAIAFGPTKKAVLFKRFPTWLNNHIHRQHVTFIGKQIDGDMKYEVLDVGCGYGRISEEVKTIAPNSNFQGIELSGEFADTFEKHLGPCYCGSFLKFECERKFDLIIVVTLLMYIKSSEMRLVVRKLHSSLTKRGVLIVIEPAEEFQRLWRRFTGKRNAGATGGDVGYFTKAKLGDILTERMRVQNSSEIKIFPFLPPVHHAFALRKM